MRHRVYGKHLNRDKNQRTSLFRGLVRGLILHESIETTQAKAKAIKGLVDKLITAGRKDTESSRRVVNAFITQQDISRKLLKDIAPRYTDRVSGYTQMVRLGNRQGDGAMMVRMSLIKDEKPPMKSSQDK